MSAILTFEQVWLRGAYLRSDQPLAGITFSLGKGDLALIHADHDSEDVPYIDLATGLLPPDEGRVLFKGQDWAVGMSYHACFRSRSRIGTLARRNIWVSNQTVLRNVVLSERHHTHRREGELEAEADDLGRQVGLTGIPRVRPDAVAVRQLRMAGWVRAFMGKPDLVVLLFPEHDAVAGWPTLLDGILAKYLAEGGAVLVVSDQRQLWELPVMESARHYGFTDRKWVLLSKDA